MHFTPTSSSWVNLVERFFAEITDKAIRNGTFKNVRELEAAIRAFIETPKSRSLALSLDSQRRQHRREGRPRPRLP